jgi:glycosyltransferase involved in cell wall biosynthesis
MMMRDRKVALQSPADRAPGDARMGGKPGKHTTIVIPAYDEEDGLLAVLNELYGVIDDGYEVLVVDDGSTDATLDVARRFPCRVVKHATNSGKGAAMRTGVALAIGENIVFIDADGTYPAGLIPEIVGFLSEGYRHVRCTRRGGRDRIPPINRVGNFFLDLGIAVFSGIWSSDFLTGLYGMKRRDLLDMKVVSEGFDIEAEIMVKAGTMGLKTKGIPFAYRERIGQVKLRSLPDGFRIGLRVINTGIAYNCLLALFVPGALLTLAGLCGLLWFTLSGIPVETQAWRVYTLSLIAYLLGGQLAVAGLGFTWHAFTQGVRRHVPLWVQELTNRLAANAVFWISACVGICGLVLTLVNASGSAQFLRWGLFLLPIGLQVALWSLSLSVALRLGGRAPEIVAHEEVDRR